MSVCNCSYKIVAKVINCHLKPILSADISHEKCGFLDQRYIHNAIRLAQEALHSIRTKTQSTLMLKMIFQKLSTWSIGSSAGYRTVGGGVRLRRPLSWKVAGSNPIGYQKSNHAKGWCGPGRVRSLGDFDGLDAPGSWPLSQWQPC